MGILERVRRVRDEFTRDFGRQPAGILLGPIEYSELLEEIRYQNRYSGYYPMYGELLLLEGLPVTMKTTPGVDLTVAYPDHLNFASIHFERGRAALPKNVRRLEPKRTEN